MRKYIRFAITIFAAVVVYNLISNWLAVLTFLALCFWADGAFDKETNHE